MMESAIPPWRHTPNPLPSNNNQTTLNENNNQGNLSSSSSVNLPAEELKSSDQPRIISEKENKSTLTTIILYIIFLIIFAAGNHYITLFINRTALYYGFMSNSLKQEVNSLTIYLFYFLKIAGHLFWLLFHPWLMTKALNITYKKAFLLVLIVLVILYFLPILSVYIQLFIARNL